MKPAVIRRTWDRLTGRPEDIIVGFIRRFGEACHALSLAIYRRYPSPEMLYLRHVYGERDALQAGRRRDRIRAAEMLIKRGRAVDPAHLLGSAPHPLSRGRSAEFRGRP